jgi:DNA invertase Pin-like site-specific DNA recombinase
MQPAEAVTMAKRLIPYSRFSGKRQEAGDSQRRQDALAEEAARQEKVQIDWSLSLRDKGISSYRGTNWHRGDLGKFLDLVDAGIVPAGSILCIEQVNRLSRLPWMEQVQLWKEILGRGIVIRTCVPPARYTRENMNELAVGCPVVLYMMLGHADSKQKSEWSGTAWAEKRRRAAEECKPHGRDCPAWLEPVTAPHPSNPARIVTLSYREIKERVAVIRRIFRDAIAGKDGNPTGAWRIRKALEDEGVPPFGRSGRWTLSYVKKLLRGREVLGEYQPNFCPVGLRRRKAGVPVANYYPQIIDESTFNAAQAARRRRTGKGGRSGNSEANLFTHLVHDAHDGSRMQCTPRWTAGRLYKYLAAPRQMQTVPYRPFERAVLFMLSRLRARDVDGRHEADALTARADALQEEQSRIALELESLDQQMRELPPARWPARVVARIAELEEALESKAAEVQAAKEAANTSGRTDALNDLRTCVELLDKASGTPKEAPLRRRLKALVALLVESIWVRVQALHRRGRYVHVRIYLRGGEQRPLVIPCGHVSKAAPLPLQNADFRAGEERGYAAKPGTGRKLKAKPLAV